MKVLSLFSGVGGFDMGLENAGMQTVFQCELDKQCQSILQRHWPHVPKWDDVKTLTGKHVLQHAPQVDVVAWGSPCQDLSVAGKRAGLKGNQSELFFEGIRIIKELRQESNNVYPRISIWENVYGAITSNGGADFGRVLDEMAEAGALVIEWRVLDAQYFGIPQRRRRVFVVAVFDPATSLRCPDPLLPLTESVRGNIASGISAQENTPSTTTASIGARGIRMRGFGDYIDDDAASAIKARDYKDATDLVVDNPSSLPILIDRATYNMGENALYNLFAKETNVAPNLTSRGPHAVLDRAIGFDSTMCMGNPNDDVSPPVKVGSGIGIVSPPAVCYTPEDQPIVRRLTPIECERLMGWPDDHTSGQADTHRYKQCGNGVASPVAQWVGEQLMRVA